jgi:hypothetical protein
MAITSRAAMARHGALTMSGTSRPNQGRLVMLTLVTFALFAVAIAFPGFIAVAMSRAVDAH